MRFLLALFVLLAVPCARSQTDALKLWIEAVRNPLQGPDGQAYFESTVKHALIPGGVNGIRELRGTVVSSRPVDAPEELVVAIVDKTTPEVTLRSLDKLDTAPVPQGSIVYFDAVAMAFRKDPFMLTMEVEPRRLRIVRSTER